MHNQLPLRGMRILSFLLFFIFALSCTRKTQTQLPQAKAKTTVYGEGDIVTSSVLDKAGNLWFGTTKEGVYRYDGTSFTQMTVRDGLCDNEVWSIIEDRKGNLWFGTGDGLCKYDGKTFTHVPIPWDGEHNLWGDMCNPNIVITMLADNNGDIWLGTCGGGAYRYDPSVEPHTDSNAFTSFLSNEGRKQSDSLHHNVVKSMLEDTAGNLWFTSLTHGGVSRYDGETFRHFTSEDGLNDDMVFASLADKTGSIWFGCIQAVAGGLYRYDPPSKATPSEVDGPQPREKTFTNFSKADGLCDNFVMSLFEDKDGNILVGTGQGVCMYDGKTFTPFPTQEDQILHEVRTFVEDKAGNIWFGGRTGRLWRYDGEILTDFTQKGR